MITLTRNPHSIRVTFSGKHITTAKRPTQLMDALLSTCSVDIDQAKRWIARARDLPIGTTWKLDGTTARQRRDQRTSEHEQDAA